HGSEERCVGLGLSDLAHFYLAEFFRREPWLDGGVLTRRVAKLGKKYGLFKARRKLLHLIRHAFAACIQLLEGGVVFPMERIERVDADNIHMSPNDCFFGIIPIGSVSQKSAVTLTNFTQDFDERWRAGRGDPTT